MMALKAREEHFLEWRENWGLCPKFGGFAQVLFRALHTLAVSLVDMNITIYTQQYWTHQE